MLEKIKQWWKKNTVDNSFEKRLQTAFTGKQRKRTSLIIMGLLFALVLLSGAMVGRRYRQEREERERLNSMGDMLVWYTNDNLTQFMEYVASDYEKKTGMHVVARKVTPSDYLEQIYLASISEEQVTPDVYITTNDCLEQAYLCGIATDQYLSFKKGEFSESAIHAVTYHGKQIAIPLYFDTSLLFYNKKYVETPPKTIDELRTFSENFEEAEGVQNILKWDCTNGFRNYFFAGNYLEVAGVDGDNEEMIDVTGDGLKQSMAYFQSMNDFFSIDIDSVTETEVFSEFRDGKTVFVFGDTSYISELSKAGMTDFGVAKLPDLSEELAGKGIAVNNVVVVNGFSKKQEAAARFAHSLSVDYSGKLYEMTGKIPSCEKANISDEACKVAQEQYANCSSLPKLMDLSDFWVQFEITMSDIWRGEDLNVKLDELKAKIDNRLAATTDKKTKE